MIKYADIEGYKNLGEVMMFSHLYQFMESNSKPPKTILIHGYDISPARVFKGFVFKNTKTYSSVKLTDIEKTELEKYVGEIQQVDFPEFARGHNMLELYQEYQESDETPKENAK